MGRKAAEAYHRGFLENLTTDPRSAVLASVGDLHTEPHAPARVA